MTRRRKVLLGTLIITTAAVVLFLVCSPFGLAPLIRALESSDEFNRTEAAEALAQLGPAAAPAVPALVKALKSRQPLKPPLTGGSLTWYDHTPDAARKALVRIGPAAVPDLTKALSDQDALTRVNAAWALWEIEENLNLVLPVLLSAWQDRSLDSEDKCIRVAACEAIGLISQKEPDRLFPIALKALQDDSEMGYDVTRVLSMMGKTDRRAVEHLFTLLDSEGDHLYRFAAFGLRDLKSASVPLLIDGLESNRPRLMWRCAWTLGGMKSTYAKPAIAALEKAKQEDKKEVRDWAHWALECIASRTFDRHFD